MAKKSKPRAFSREIQQAQAEEIARLNLTIEALRRDMLHETEEVSRLQGLFDAAVQGQNKLKRNHEEYAAHIDKLQAEDKAKLVKENADLKQALSELFPVFRRLLDWQINHPLR